MEALIAVSEQRTYKIAIRDFLRRVVQFERLLE
jgi:hypothetical protein